MNKKETQELDNSLKLIAKTSIIVFVCIILSKILTYVYRIIIANYFGSEVYGLFSLAVMMTGWFVAIFSLGLIGGVIRFISLYRGEKQEEKIKQIIHVSTLILTISSIISAIIFFLSAEFISINIFHNPDLIIFLKWFSLVIPITILSGIFLSILQSFEKITFYSFNRQVLDNSVKVVSILLLIFIGVKINSVIFSYILGLLAMLLASYFLSRIYFPNLFTKIKLDKKIKSEINRDLFAYSWPLIFTGLVAFIFTWIDTFTIGYFKTASDVGIYNVAIPLAALLSITPGLFIQLFLPLITKEYASKNFKVINAMSKQVGKWIFLINLPVLILMLLFPGAIINLFFTEEYLTAANSLRFLAIGMFFYSIFILSENLLSMAGKTKVILFNIVISSILNLILNILLVPNYGIEGAAFSTMITYIFWSLLSLYQSKKNVSVIPLKGKMLIILLASIIPTIAIIFINNILPSTSFYLIAQVALFSLIYLICIFLTKSLDENDLMVIKSFKNKIHFKPHNHIPIEE